MAAQFARRTRHRLRRPADLEHHGGRGLRALPDLLGRRAAPKWNLWGYVDARDVAAAARLGLEAAIEGAQIAIVAAADTVMTRPSADLMAEVFPTVPLRRRGRGPRDPALDRPCARAARLRTRPPLGGPRPRVTGQRRAGLADLRARRRGRRVASDPGRGGGIAAGPVPAGDRRADPRRPPGTRGRRSRLVLGRRRRRHRDRLGPATDAGPRPGGRARPGPAGGPAASSTTPGRRSSRGPRAIPDGRGARLGGRGRRRPTPDERRAGRGGRGRGATPAGARRRARRPGRDPAADARRDRRRGARARPVGGDLHADLQRLRRPGDRDPAGRLRGVGPHHRRRLPPPRGLGAPQGGRRRGRRRGAVGRAASSSSGARARRSRRRGRPAAMPGGTTPRARRG